MVDLKVGRIGKPLGAVLRREALARLRVAAKLMNRYGEWLQLSVFQCRLTRKRKVELRAALAERINNNADHVLLLDLGQPDKVELRVASLGKVFAAVDRQPILV